MDTAKDRTLDMFPPGAVASVVRVSGEDLIARRLSDLGFWPGTEVRVVRVAPLGDPVQYALRGYRLALRRAEAGRVLVRPAEGATEGER